ncbi:CBS domain-containing protein, partial [bacterium]
SPVITCAAADTIDQVAEILTKNRITALVVVDSDQKPVGIITDSDLVSKVLTRKECANTTLTAADVMSPNPITLPPDAFFYQALLTMAKNKVKQLPIISDGQLLGIVTVRDLVQSRSTGALTIVDGIETSGNIDELVKASEQVDNVLKALVAEKASNQEICEVITEFYDRLTRKVIEISEQEMQRENYGPPPTPYCWITMGSGGRREQTLRTDQDNGIVYADVPIGRAKVAAAYFAALAAKIVEGLARCGFAKCKGNVMATNPQWCKSVREWEEMVTHWVLEPNGEMLLNFTIFLDFRAAYGQKSLAENLRRFVIKSIQDRPIVLHFLAKEDLARRVPLGIFKQFITNKSKEHRNEINLKRDACVHVVDCVRIFSIREGISETSTIGRLK